MPNKIVGNASISGKHDGTPLIVHAVTEGRLEWRVIDLERRDPQTALVEHDSFVDVVSEENDAVGRGPVIVQTDSNVRVVCLLEIRQHLLRAPRSPDREWTIAPRAYEPARQPEIREADDVIRVEMGQ